MNNENVVTHPLVTHQPIPPSDLPREDFSRDYKKINFLMLLCGLNRDYGSGLSRHFFLNFKKGITFRDYFGRQLMTGNELLYYPELAKKVHEIDDYPVFKRSYKVDETIEGLEFFDYFNHSLKASHRDFTEALNQVSMQVNQLIDDYGQKRFTPILNNEKYKPHQPLVIHGIEWFLKGSFNHFKKSSPAHCIDLHRLFNIPTKIMSVCVEEVIPQTPFIAVRIRKNGGYKGYVKWYSLDTRQVIAKREINRWKKPL